MIQDRLRHGVNTMGAFNKATVLLFSIHDFDEMINFWTPQKVQYLMIKCTRDQTCTLVTHIFGSYILQVTID